MTMSAHSRRRSQNVSSEVRAGLNARSCVGTCHSLEQLFPQWWKKVKHDTKDCWYINPKGKLLHNRVGGFWYDKDQKVGPVRALTWRNRNKRKEAVQKGLMK